MIKLNRMTDYGAVVLSILAFQWRFDHGVSLSANDISSRSGISPASTAKILKMLAASGLVEATRGKHGGYLLAASPEHVSVAAIIEALEGPIALTACVETSADPCSSKHSCFLSGHWEKVNATIASALTAMTLADLIDPDHYFKPASTLEGEQDLQPKHH